MSTANESAHWDRRGRHRRPLTWPEKWCLLVVPPQLVTEAPDPETGEIVRTAAPAYGHGWHVLGSWRTYAAAKAEAVRLQLLDYDILTRQPYSFPAQARLWWARRRK